MAEQKRDSYTRIESVYPAFDKPAKRVLLSICQRDHKSVIGIVLANKKVEQLSEARQRAAWKSNILSLHEDMQSVTKGSATFGAFAQTTRFVLRCTTESVLTVTEAFGRGDLTFERVMFVDVRILAPNVREELAALLCEGAKRGYYDEPAFVRDIKNIKARPKPTRVLERMVAQVRYF